MLFLLSAERWTVSRSTQRSRLLVAALVAAQACSHGTEPRSLVAASVRITPGDLTLERAASAPLTAKAFSADSAELRGVTITWSSNTPGVATVSRAGVVSALSRGTAVIVAQTGSVVANATVTVTDAFADIPAGVAVLPGPAFLFPGMSYQLVAVVSNRWREPIPGAAVQWTVSAPRVAAVSASGVIHALDVGVASVIASSGGISSEPRELEVAGISAARIVGARKFVPASEADMALVVDLSSGPQSVDVLGWSSSDASVATISAGGVVTAHDSGVANITALTAAGAVTVPIETRPLSGRIVYQQGRYIESLTLDGAPPRELHVSGSTAPIQPQLSLNGTRVALDCPGACWLSLDDPVLTAHPLGLGSQPSLNTDGSLFVVRSTGAHLYVLGPHDDPSAPSGIISTNGCDPFIPRLSPTGQDVLYGCEDIPYESPLNLYLANRLTGLSQLVVADGYAPAWAPDGQWVSYDEPSRLCITAVARWQCTPLTSHAESARVESGWSPDGAHLVLAKGGELMVIDRNGENAIRLSRAGKDAWSPSWGLFAGKQP